MCSYIRNYSLKSCFLLPLILLGDLLVAGAYPSHLFHVFVVIRGIS